MTKKFKEHTAATFTIHRASDMTPVGRKEIAAWLRKQAANLVKHGANYSKRVTARYLYWSKP